MNSRKINKRVRFTESSMVNISDFKIIRKLGDGAQGNVYMVEKLVGKDSGTVYAMKTFDKKVIMDCQMAKNLLLNERNLMLKVIRAPFLSQMIYAFESKNYFYIVMEFAQGGELFNLMNKNGPMTALQARFYIAELILALERLHKCNIMYRDLKLENILLDADGHVVLTDFGLSIDLSIQGVPEKELAGTIDYLPPELFNEDVDLGLISDWWCVGILAHELIGGSAPYQQNLKADRNEFFQRLINDEPKISDSIQGSARNFIMKLLEKDVTKRLGANGFEEVKKHPFFRGIDWNLMKAKKYPPPINWDYTNKFDVSQFDESFTNVVIGLIDGELNDKKELEGFSYTSLCFDNKKNVGDKHFTIKEIIEKENLKLIYNENAKILANKCLYIDNKDRALQIVQRCDYKK